MYANEGGYSADQYGGPGAEIQFSEKSIRLGKLAGCCFIRKVYSILMVQLAVTVAFIALFLFEPSVKQFSKENPGLYIAAFVVTFVLIIVMACCENVRRNYPTNIILLGLFTLCEGFLLGTVTSYYSADAVLMAAGITTVVCLALTIFAFQTKWDFTTMGGIMFVCLIVLLCFGFLTIFIRSRILNLIYASLGALIFSVYLVIDTQMMMGGSHKYSISPEEYIFAALNLYLDIVNIFLFILSIIGSRD